MSRVASRILALSLGLVAVPAAAQYGPGPYGPPAGPLPVNAGPYVPPAPFTGLRVEGLAGFDRFQRRGHDDGVAYGIGVGYDVQYGRAIVGVEGELSDSNTKQCFGSRYSGYDYCAHADRDFYVGGRIGTVLTPRTMIYAKAGYTNAEIKVTADDGRDRFTLGHTDLDGVRVGAGLEYQLFQNAYAKAEYRYSNYQDGFSRNQVVGGFGVRF